MLHSVYELGLARGQGAYLLLLISVSFNPPLSIFCGISAIAAWGLTDNRSSVGKKDCIVYSLFFILLLIISSSTTTLLSY